jgi:hypothetical protein
MRYTCRCCSSMQVSAGRTAHASNLTWATLYLGVPAPHLLHAAYIYIDHMPE